MGSGGSAQALQLTPQEAADVGTFVATGLSGVPSLKKKLEDLQAGAQESEKLRQKVVQLEEEILALRQAKESGAMQGSECRLQNAHSTKFQKITASIDAIFSQFASGPCGIGAEHLSLAMRFLGLSPTQDEVQQCLDKMGCPNHLEHAKFHDLMQEELDKHFAKVQVQEFAGFLRGFDLEGKGSLSVKDFQEAMGGSISDEKLRALLQRVPRTGQGDLEFIELAKCFQEPGESLEVDQTAEDGGDKKVFVALLSGKDCECLWSQDRTIRQLKEEAQQKLDIKIKNLIGPSMEVLDEERMLEEESIVPGTTLTVVAVDHAAEDKEEAARCQDIFAAAVLGKLGATRHFLRMDPGAACKTENCSHSTALHLAAHHGHVAICEVLLAARAEVDAMCLGRWSPLHSAAQNGQADAVKLLLEAKASVTRNEEGKTPLDLARRRGKTEVMRILEAAA